MDPALLAAVITASGACVASTIAAFISWTTQRGQARNGRELIQLKNELETDTRNQEREISARAKLDNLREPLLAAARDLQQRIWNIRKNEFTLYIRNGDTHRGEVALLGTLYRFARYWALQELLHSQDNLLRFESDADTHDVVELIDSIRRTFASDSTGGPHLIFWREEQRAVAELMADSGAPLPSITGFATFRIRYMEDARREQPQDLALWFKDFARDLQFPAITESDRLRLLDERLSALVRLLENGRNIAPNQ